MRLFACSDLHVDYQTNGRAVEQLSNSDFRGDALIIAGDLTDNLELLTRTLAGLVRKFAKTFFVPGNHELWTSKGGEDSLAKFERILALCASLDVLTFPAEAELVRVVPLFSWYDSTLYPHETPDPEQLLAWADYHRCYWPTKTMGGSTLAALFAARNQFLSPAVGRLTVSFSHFLPRIELLGDLDGLYFKPLVKVAGSTLIECQLRALGTSVHIFGHSHINVDCVIDGIRYVQHSLGYPSEHKSRNDPGGAILKLIVADCAAPW